MQNGSWKCPLVSSYSILKKANPELELIKQLRLRCHPGRSVRFKADPVDLVACYRPDHCISSIIGASNSAVAPTLSLKKPLRADHNVKTQKKKQKKLPVVEESFTEPDKESIGHKKSVIANNIFGLLCLQNLIQRKVRWIREKSVYQKMNSRNSRPLRGIGSPAAPGSPVAKTRAGALQTSRSSSGGMLMSQSRISIPLVSLRMDTMKEFLRDRTQNFMCGCLYESTRKIFMGKVLAVLINRYVRKLLEPEATGTSGLAANTKVIVFVSVVQCANQGVLVASRSLLDLSCDRFFSLTYKFQDAVTVVTIYLISRYP